MTVSEMLKDCWNQFLSGKKKSKNFNLIFSFEFHSRTLLLVASSYLKGRYRHRLTDNHLSLESEGEPPWWFCSFNLIIRKSYMVFAVSLLHTCTKAKILQFFREIDLWEMKALIWDQFCNFSWNRWLNMFIE